MSTRNSNKTDEINKEEEEEELFRSNSEESNKGLTHRQLLSLIGERERKNVAERKKYIYYKLLKISMTLQKVGRIFGELDGDNLELLIHSTKQQWEKFKLDVSNTDQIYASSRAVPEKKKRRKKKVKK